MKILICNVGSTSLKYKIYEMPEKTPLCWGHIESIGSSTSPYYHSNTKGLGFTINANIPDFKHAILQMIDNLLNSDNGVISNLGEISAVGFKVVHAKGVSGVQILNDKIIRAMEDYISIAPAHNPPYINAIKQFKDILPNNIPLIGCFETSFHKSIPSEAYLYGIPYELYEKHGIRKYGFHGASHEYASQRISEIHKKSELKMISCHLGGSSSLCAIKNGKSVDTTLGFSLQTGIDHNNRCGDIDPFIPLYLMEKLHYSLEEVKTILTQKSGLLGLSGVSSDLRQIEIAFDKGNVRSKKTIDSYCYKIKKYIGSYLFVMGGLDIITFSGGIGENSIKIREKILKDLAFAGIFLDKEKNKVLSKEAIITTSDSPVKVFVIPTNEELIITNKVYSFLTSETIE